MSFKGSMLYQKRSIAFLMPAENITPEIFADNEVVEFSINFFLNGSANIDINRFSLTVSGFKFVPIALTLLMGHKVHLCRSRSTATNTVICA